MESRAETATVVGIFERSDQMETAVEQLLEIGFRDDQISVPGQKGRGEGRRAAGATVGLVLGSFAGALAAGSSGAPTREGLGGFLARVIGGAALGATVGGLLGMIDGSRAAEEGPANGRHGPAEETGALLVAAGDRYPEAERVLYDRGASRILHRYPGQRTEIPGSGRPFHVVDEGDEIRIPLYGEEIEIEKLPVVTERIHVGKRKVEETRRVSDVVRREEIKIHRRGPVKVHETSREEGHGAGGPVG